MSLVSRHLARHAAGALASAAVIATAAAAPPVSNPEYAAMLEQLGEDLQRLSNTQSVELKIKAKAEMIGRYDDWVLGALVAGEQGKAAQDEVVATMLVWNIDVQNWTMALQIGAHVLTHGLSLPERYKRTPATLIAEEIADTSLKLVEAVDHGTLIATQVLTDEHDMPDQVRAKLMKAIGRKLMAEADAFDPDAEGATAGGKPALISAAVGAFKRALILDDKAGVKRDIENLERELKNLTPPT
jgi:hypothetical protein